MIRKIVLLIHLCIWASLLNAQSNDQNYIRTRAMLNASGTEYIDQIQYFDGLGRPIQTVQKQVTPSRGDLATYQEYDAFGREFTTWDPVVTGTTSGAYMPLTTLKTKSVTTYADSKAYSRTKYESSPLDRVISQTGPGEHWHNSNVAVHTEYLINTQEGELACKWFETTNDRSVNEIGLATQVKVLVSGGLTLTSGGKTLTSGKTTSDVGIYYPTGELFVTKLTDEEGNVSYEFKNKLNQVILTRQMNGTEMLDTYYVYDHFGNLRAVLPPLAVDELNESTLNLYAYQYKYDSRNRMTEKKLPGCVPMKYMYDKADRLIFTQDGEMRDKGLWMFNIPDALGRIVLTGTTNQVTDVSEVVVNGVRSDESGGFKGYTLTGISLNQPEIHTVNYYDNYSFLGKYGIPQNETVSEITPKGLQTGTLTAQFTSEGVDVQYLYGIMYYDSRGRMIQALGNNHLGGQSKELISYTFTGKPLERRLETTISEENIVELYNYEYDHAERITKITHKLGNNTPMVLVENTYDDLGRISQIKRNDKQSLTNSFAYNIRSWVTRISGSQFTEDLSYKLDGNIAAMQWNIGGQTHKYNYTYDGISRLTSADYQDGTYSTSYSYDKHGNIQHIQRGTDNLNMNYIGNQLISINSPDASLYAYNKNGGMSKDLSKNMTDISYNALSLPSRVEIDNTVHTYTYAANGSKLRVQQGADRRDYVGNIIYEKGSLKRILIEGGYIEDGKYHFYFDDHLGNNNVVADANGLVVQRNNYYPFGLPMVDTSSVGQDVQPYKFGGKEFDRKNGLNLYDFEARQMDPVLGRFTTMDPLAEKYYGISPYAYCANNPMRFVDPTGMRPEEDMELRRIQEDKEAASIWTKIKMFFDDKFSISVDTRPKEQQQSISDKKMARGDYDNSKVDAMLNGPDAIGLSANVSGQMVIGGVDASIGVVYITKGSDKGLYFVGEGGVPVLSSGFSASVSGNVSFTYGDNSSDFGTKSIKGVRNEVNVGIPFAPISVSGFQSITPEGKPGTFGFSVGGGVSVKKMLPTSPVSYKVVNTTIFK